MSKSKAMQTDQTYCSDNTLPIIFMNNLKEPILASGMNLPIKREIKPRGSVQLPKQTIEARDVIQKYYEEHDMRPFFNSRPNYKPNIETPFKVKNESVRYSHIKPRINTNIQRAERSNKNRSISFSEKSKTIDVNKSSQHRKVILKNTPKMQLYLRPMTLSRDEMILPKIGDNDDKEASRVDYVNTEPITHAESRRTQQSSKEMKNESSQTVRPERSRIISYQVVNTTIKPTLKIPKQIQERIEEKQDQEQDKEEGEEEVNRVRQRKNSLESQTFSVMTKPNFDLSRFGERMAGGNQAESNNNNHHTNRGSTHSTSFNWRKNINPDITEEKMTDMVKQFKPKSDLLKDADVTAFKIKKYKNGVYFGTLIKVQKEKTDQEQGETQIKNGLGCIFYYNGRLYEGQFQKDFKNGKGYQLYPDSSYYHGDFKAGHKEGKGVFVWNNGEMYWGEWAQGKKHGSGTWKGVEGSKDSYFGQWYNGKPHGFGVLTNSVGDVYEGQFKLSVKDGKGTERFANGDVYVGQYLKGRRNGPKETMYYKSGEVYIGEFCNDLRHGKGFLKGADQKPIYEGEFMNDKKCGLGMMWLDKGIYEGNFENDLMHGVGKIVGFNHTVRNGYWVNGKQMFENKFNDKQTTRLQSINQQYRSNNFHTLNAHPHPHPYLHNRSVSISKSPKAVSFDKKILKSVRSDNKFADLRKAYLTRKKHTSVESNFHRRACGCLKKK